MVTSLCKTVTVAFLLSGLPLSCPFTHVVPTQGSESPHPQLGLLLE